MSTSKLKYRVSLGSIACCPNEIERTELREFAQSFDFSPGNLTAGVGYFLATGDTRDAPGPTRQLMIVGNASHQDMIDRLFGDGNNPSSFEIELTEEGEDPEQEEVDLGINRSFAFLTVTLMDPRPVQGGYRFMVVPQYVRAKDDR